MADLPGWEDGEALLQRTHLFGRGLSRLAVQALTELSAHAARIDLTVDHFAFLMHVNGLSGAGRQLQKLAPIASPYLMTGYTRKRRSDSLKDVNVADLLPAAWFALTAGDPRQAGYFWREIRRRDTESFGALDLGNALEIAIGLGDRRAIGGLIDASIRSLSRKTLYTSRGGLRIPPDQLVDARVLVELYAQGLLSERASVSAAMVHDIARRLQAIGWPSKWVQRFFSAAEARGDTSTTEVIRAEMEREFAASEWPPISIEKPRRRRRRPPSRRTSENS
jgi:hypothetical protein